jgi:enoyl-CoA hydratase/carnithine racemase
MTYQAIMFARRGHIALVTMNRPARLNAVDTALQVDLRAACRAAPDTPATTGYTEGSACR